MGPTIVAATKDVLFGEDQKIGLALALVTTLAAIAGFLLLSLAARMTSGARRSAGATPVQPAQAGP
jgi:hypothetical protein